jgi:nucleotide-binding universal stress UspA family protein
MFRDLLVPCVAGEAPEDALLAAVALADRTDGHVTALVNASAVAPISTAWDYFPPGIYQSLRDAADAAASRLGERVESVLSSHSVASSVRQAGSPWLTPVEVAVTWGRVADLNVLGALRKRLPDVERALFAGLLFETGRPLLWVPGGARWPGEGARAMVAWRPGASASRALHDALPLLRLASAVDVVMVEPKVGATADSAMPGADVAAHLARHDLKVEVVTLPREGQGTGEALLRRARESGTGWMVCGGFGHSRLREMVLGGVTRHLHEHATLPVVFSH